MNLTLENNDRLVVLSEQLERVQKTVDRIDADFAKDREDIHEFRMRLGALEGEINELRKQLKGQAEDVQEKVTEAIEPLTDSIANKTIIRTK